MKTCFSYRHCPEPPKLTKCKDFIPPSSLLGEGLYWCGLRIGDTVLNIATVVNDTFAGTIEVYDHAYYTPFASAQPRGTVMTMEQE